MRRLRFLLLIALALLATLPAAASAKAPGLARVEGTGSVDFTARGRAQLFGEVDHGRLVWLGRRAPRVLTCADMRPLRRCAVRRPVDGGIEWLIYKPARIFVIGRDFRLLLQEAGAFELGITGTGSLAVDGSGSLTVASGERRAYDGTDAVLLERTRRSGPTRDEDDRRLP